MNTDDILLQLIGRALFSRPVTFDAPAVNWEELYREAAAQAVLPLVYECLTEEERGCMAEKTAALWDRAFASHIARNLQLLEEQKRVIRMLEDAEIPSVILKGSSVGVCYPDPVLRAYGDMDFLVRPQQQDAAIGTLQKAGYARYSDEPHHCEVAMKKGRYTVEIHWEPNGIFLAGDMAEPLRSHFQGAVERRVLVDSLPLPSVCDEAVSLLLHALEHLMIGGLGLRQLCDWAVFVHQNRTEALWQTLRPLFASFGILYTAGILTRACIEALGLPREDAPWAMAYSADEAQALVGKMVTDGNFGCKTERYGERLFTNPHAGNRVSSLFRVLGQACREKWPPCERHRVLMPVAPFVLYGKYRKRRRAGTRPELKLMEKYRNAGKQQDFNKSLRPFQAEDAITLTDTRTGGISHEEIYDALWEPLQDNRFEKTSFVTVWRRSVEPDGRCFLALCGGTIVGTLSVGRIELQEWYAEGTAAYYLYARVAPAWQGHHINAMLTKEVEAYAAEHGMPYILLRAAAANHHAIVIYRHYGFRMVHMWYAKGHGSSVFMIKYLDAEPHRLRLRFTGAAIRLRLLGYRAVRWIYHRVRRSDA